MGLENNIPEDWIQATLGDVCENISRRFNFQDKETVVFVNTGDVSNGKFLHHNKISKEGLPGQAKKAIKIGDILYSEIRPKNKRFAIVDFDSQDYVVSTKFMVLKRNDKIDLDFFYLFLKSNKTIKAFQSHAEARSGTFPQITFDTISLDEINLPPLPEQKAIAKVLTAFDDKIELLQAQNKTLETMAQTIFKEWFGKYQIGDVLPEGWREYELGDVCNLSAGGDKPKNSTSKSEGENIIPIYSNGIKNEGLYGFTNNASIFEESVTVSARGTIGYVCLRPIPYVPIVRLVSVIPDKNYLSAKFLFYFLKNNQILGTGTTQQQLTIPDFKLTRIIIPTSRLMDDFTKLINTVYIKIYSCKNQIQSLTKTRDTLLPKLMSGQVRVNNLKQTIDA